MNIKNIRLFLNKIVLEILGNTIWGNLNPGRFQVMFCVINLCSAVPFDRYRIKPCLSEKSLGMFFLFQIMSFDTLGDLQKRHQLQKLGFFLSFFFYFTWNLYLSFKDYKCHLCNVKLRKKNLLSVKYLKYPSKLSFSKCVLARSQKL